MLNDGFPSPIFVGESWLEINGQPKENLLYVTQKDTSDETTNDIIEAINKQGEEIAILMIDFISHRVSHYFDIKRIVSEAHKHGIIVLLDLAHSAGCVPLHLHEWDVDAASLCTYKYLSCGPGNSGFMYLNQKHRELQPAIKGWWGLDTKHFYVMA